MAKDISEIFSQTVNKFRAARAQDQPIPTDGLSPLERDFETVKDQIRKLKPQIEAYYKGKVEILKIIFLGAVIQNHMI